MLKFNVPYLTGKEKEYLDDALRRLELSGDGFYTKKCSELFYKRYNFKYNYLTTSGTDALEMAAILSDINEGDEVIMPSFTFVSTANAFVLRGAIIKFVDSKPDSPNIDENLIEESITDKTKAIVVVHYGGVACNMDKILSIAKKHKIVVIEDAAHSIDSYYKDKPLGSIGDFGAFSFHSTKNIIAGEGGMLLVNDNEHSKRAEIIREKGTNRTAFFRGDVDKYGWVDVGSSFLPSELTSAFLYAQLNEIDTIQNKRIAVWENYNKNLTFLSKKGFQLPTIPEYATNNAHLFYLVCPTGKVRNNLIDFLKDNKIKAVFHYQSLHNSAFYKKNHANLINKPLVNSEMYSERLVRLPLFPDLTENQLSHICESINQFSLTL